MGTRRDVTMLGPLELVEMFVLDTTPIGGADIFYWHPGTTVTHVPIIWQGRTYQPFPIEVEGCDMDATGKLPRPTLRCSNIGGAIGAYVRTLQDGLGATVRRKRALGKYLDAVNFPGGNPYADPNTHFPDDLFYVARKTVEDPIFVEFELAAKFDVAGIDLPRRQVIAGTCQWVYRSEECTYKGPPVQDIDGNPTTVMAKDQCRKTLAACKARFGTKLLPTSAFPASLLVRNV